MTAGEDYADRIKALRKTETSCKHCGSTDAERYFGYGDNAECEDCALGEGTA